jgi:hypothetical protein
VDICKACADAPAVNNMLEAAIRIILANVMVKSWSVPVCSRDDRQAYWAVSAMSIKHAAIDALAMLIVERTADE